MRGSLATFFAFGLAASAAACASPQRQSVLFASWSAGPYAPMPGQTLLRVDAVEGVDVERVSDSGDRWELVCAAPCQEAVPARSTFRFVTPSISSRAFTLPQEAYSWMYLALDRDGSVWTLDSPSLRAVRFKTRLPPRRSAE